MPVSGAMSLRPRTALFGYSASGSQLESHLGTATELITALQAVLAPLAQWQSNGLLIRRFWVRIPGGARARLGREKVMVGPVCEPRTGCPLGVDGRRLAVDG